MSISEPLPRFFVWPSAPNVFERAAGRSRQRRIRSLLFCVTLGALLSFAAASHADQQFPKEIANQLNMPCVPQCSICHKDLSGGFGTVDKAFGKAMQGAGLTFLVATVAPALAGLRADQIDSDHDGVDDVAQLSAGVDPSSGAVICGSGAPPIPQYGCGAHIARLPSPDRGGSLSTLLVVAALGASVYRGRRRQVARSQLARILGASGRPRRVQERHK